MKVAKKNGQPKTSSKDFVTEHYKQHGREIQKYGEVVQDLPHRLDAKVRGAMVAKLNQLLADSIQLRDMYKKHHWQVAGPTFYQLHLLFDKHFGEQVEIVDTIAERIQLLGGVSIAMGGDVAAVTKIPSPPRGREEVPVQISRLLAAHKTIMQDCHDIAEAADDAGDDGTNDLVVSDVLRVNELQSWFIGNHLVAMPLTIAE
jgi:starvation-inducible DNA-binding protein